MQTSQQQPLLKKQEIHQIGFLIILSFLYVLIFFPLYYMFHNTILASTSLILLIPVTWILGIKSGFSLFFLNTLWTGIIIQIISKDGSHFIAPVPLIGTALLVGIILLTNVARSFNQKLKKEIEDRKSAERQLRAYQSQLENQINQRTEWLENTYKKIHLNEKLEAIGQLAGGVAHDFNNRLTIILGYCELLMKHLEHDAMLYNYAKQIMISGQHSSQLTKQLLAFARKGVYKSQTVNINEIVSEIIALLARSVPDTIILSHSLKALKPYCWGGASQIQSAIFNLALNARDAIREKGTLSIKTVDVYIDDAFKKHHDLSCENGAYVSIAVTDDGIGIPPDIRKHIFEPFFTTKSDGKGTGMGLASVYGIIQSHKGAIEISSIPGKGSTFTLYFPMTKKKIGTTDSIVRSEFNSHNEHIFVVDDEILAAETIKTMLELIGYKVSLAFSGTEALRIYKEKHQTFDAVLLDMSMPDMSGLETFRALKEINPAIIAILISGHALNIDTDQFAGEGISGFLQKPCDRYEIHILIQKSIGAQLLDSKNILRTDR